MPDATEGFDQLGDDSIEIARAPTARLRTQARDPLLLIAALCLERRRRRAHAGSVIGARRQGGSELVDDEHNRLTLRLPSAGMASVGRFFRD
jgi:hypothetical protein